MSEIILEQKYLDNTVSRYDEMINIGKINVDKYKSFYKDNPFQLADLIYRQEAKMKMLQLTKTKPYFARIDFKNNNVVENLYIGKVGVTDEKEQMVTVDWRAPIASIYYDSNIGKASYKSPIGEITGELLLKRQFTIDDEKVLDYQDIDSVANDEFLKPFLGVSSDSRLKNIVSTIQNEQNAIIRMPINKDVIIQGVAGSGKTTVALHRIAYLVYNYIDTVKTNEYLVIGPNKVFMTYISNVLPDLDVDSASQFTYDEVFGNLLNIPYNMLESENKLNLKEEDLIFDKLRLKMEYKKLIDIYLEKYFESKINNNDFYYKGFKVLDYNVIKDIYDEVSKNEYEIYKDKIDRLVLLLSKKIDTYKPGIILKARDKYYNESLSLSAKDKEKFKKELSAFEKEVTSKCTSSLRSYFSYFRPNVITMYINFLTEYKDSNDSINSKIISKIISNIRKKNFEFEDLPAIMYLHYKFYGEGNYSKYKHTVIDEAQDFGEFNFYILKKLMPKCTFSIFGDLAQSIYDYRSIDTWNDLKIANYDKASVEYLKKSYRTTTEIMNEANKIIRHINLPEAIPVIRHGKKVVYKKVSDFKNIDLINTLNEYLKKDFKSIAVICKSINEQENIYNTLKEEGFLVNSIDEQKDEYKSGITVINASLVKGLEFDAAIITNANSRYYDINKSIDMKLLYVAMTRAMHELTVLYTKDLVEVLK